MDHGALAGAARSHHGHYFSRRYFQIDVAQNFPGLVAIGFVGKAHIFEADVGGEGWQWLGAGLLPDIVFGVHKFKNFRRCANGLLEIVIEESKLADRIVEFENRDDERQKCSGGEDVVIDLLAAQQQAAGRWRWRRRYP